MSEKNPHAETVTELIERIRTGDRTAMDRLFTLVYTELRAIAGAAMSRERTSHTLEATALVHEAYARLTAGENPDWKCRAYFFRAAARAMSQILIEHARKRRDDRAAGGTNYVIDWLSASDEASSVEVGDELASALEALGRVHGRTAEILWLRFLAGLDVGTVAEQLGIGETTVKTETRFGLAWLQERLEGRSG